MTKLFTWAGKYPRGRSRIASWLEDVPKSSPAAVSYRKYAGGWTAIVSSKVPSQLEDAGAMEQCSSPRLSKVFFAPNSGENVPKVW